MIAYADDIHLIGSPATVGLALSPGKTSILLGKEATPEALESGLGSDLLTRLDATICHG